MFEGAIVAIVTPFRNGGIDEEALRKLIDFQIANGTKGIVPCGTTGESPTLSFAEHKRVIEITVDQVKHRVPVIAGTGSNNTEEAVQLTQHARSAGADAALMISPYYNKPGQEGLYRHYRKVAESVDIPIIVYNIPGRTAVNIEPHTVARLAELKNIIGIKEASGSMKQITDVIALCGKDFVVLSGEDYLTFPLMCVGGRGVISVVSNIAPRGMADMCEFFLKGEFAEARELYYRLLPLCHVLFCETNPAPVKAAMAMMKLIESEEVRLPLSPISEQSRERVRSAMKDFGLIEA